MCNYINRNTILEPSLFHLLPHPSPSFPTIATTAFSAKVIELSSDSAGVVRQHTLHKGSQSFIRHRDLLGRQGHLTSY